MKEIQINQDLCLKKADLTYARPLAKLIDENRAYLKQWLPWLDYSTTEEDSFHFLKRSMKEYDLNTGRVFAIFYCNKLSGVISLNDINQEHKKAAIGYWVSQENRGKGMARLASAAITKHAFLDLGLNRIEIRCAPGNTASKSIPKNLGFKYEGLLRDMEWLYDHFVDHEVYSMLKNEWTDT